MRKTILFIFMSVSICSFAFAEQLTITTYYPAPFGVYSNLEAENLDMRNLTANPAIEFYNDAGVSPDVSIILTGNNSLSMKGGIVTFSDDTGNPTIIKTGEVWFCADY